MNSIILLDTSVLCEWFEVPGKSAKGGHRRVTDAMKAYVKDGCDFFLPLASVVETGNHIAHVATGNARRRCANLLAELIENCITAEHPYATIAYWDEDELKAIAREFRSNAMSGISMGDTSIIGDFKRLCEDNPTAMRIKIWSMDGHLDTYEKLSSLTEKE